VIAHVRDLCLSDIYVGINSASRLDERFYTRHLRVDGVKSLRAARFDSSEDPSIRERISDVHLQGFNTSDARTHIQRIYLGLASTAFCKLSSNTTRSAERDIDQLQRCEIGS
jgi:hypothetical protein